MTNKFNIDNRELLQRISSGEAVVGIDFGNLIVRELAAFRLAAMENEPLAVTDDELNAALQLHRLKVDGHSQLSDAFRAGFRYARRTTPQPAPVVPELRVDWQENEFSAGWNACRAAMLQAGNSPVIPEGYVMVPMRLTAENGAKGALSGEFSETWFVNCPECFGNDECETCDGSGRIEITVPVTWTTIKEIWAKGVEHFSATPREVKGE
ncbi:hypothetical protein [Klebsiella pneumoniae]|uniref:hypothetical protein n=1 Tax=Klebsiella pneumoniae TaxID=573 RepID=UPI001F5BF4FF|nr:hypothetical protein [Klebsiella pneumoniae]